jgi:hypothetical protein
MDDTDPRPFDEFFREHRRGQSMYEASEVLRELVAAVEETGKGGSMTIKLSIKPDKKYGTTVEVRDEITAKLPQPEKGASLFYMDGSHNLVRNDPNQMTIPNQEN